MQKCEYSGIVQNHRGISRYANANKDIFGELDINPLFVYPEGEGAGVADARLSKHVNNCETEEGYSQSRSFLHSDMYQKKPSRDNLDGMRCRIER